MVMHSTERGECRPRTLVDRKWRRYDNAVDVVICLHDRHILVSKVWHLRDLHTFGSVTSMNSRSSRVLRESFVSMTAWWRWWWSYRRKASPKHYDDMTKVDCGGGGHRTAKRSMINLCVYGVPPPPYIKKWRRGMATFFVSKSPF